MDEMADDLNEVSGSGVVRSLTRAWFVALGVVALLTVVAQIIIQLALARAELDARVMNLAGRQRMLSQAMTKAALDVVRQPSAEGADRLENWRQQWLLGHQQLARGSDLPGAGRDNSPHVAQQFAELQPIVEEMARTSSIEAVNSGIAGLLRAEPDFLRRMDQLVDTYQLESTQRVTWVRLLEVIIHSTLLMVLVIEAWFVFRPTVGRLRDGLRMRAQLAKEEMDKQVLATEARVAERIGQDLHDGLGQQLTALSLTGARLHQNIGDHPLMQQMLKDLSSAIATTRSVARRLAPAGIHQGLHHALGDLAQATHACGVACHYQGLPLPDLPMQQAEDVLRIAQEGVNNALRHAQPQAIELQLKRLGKMIVFTIADDGCGFVQNTGQLHKGLGLQSMRMRAQRLGGDLEIQSSPSRGTLIRCAFPVLGDGTGDARGG